jgi:hypothetical protein
VIILTYPQQSWPLDHDCPSRPYQPTYSYDAPENPYWVSEIQHTDSRISLPADSLVAGYAYSYDQAGNRLAMTESNASGGASHAGVLCIMLRKGIFEVFK